jgi:hypothetical protein
MIEEQRQAPRVQAAYQILYECFRRDEKVSEGAAQTVNLSERGALIELAQEVAPDASMILWIFAPFYTLLVKGNVVHSHRNANGLFRVGVKLTDVIEGTWDVLKKDIHARANETAI